MIVKAYYSGGRIDVFDTDRMTDGVPQPGNLLTNYALDLSDVNGESLWLCSYYYEAAQAYKDEKGPKDLPVARRRDGWSFLLADAEDMERLNRVTVDGETVLVQVAGELVDMSALSWASFAAEQLIPQALNAHDFIRSDLNYGDEETACSKIGISSNCFNTIVGYSLPGIRDYPQEPRF